MSQHRSRRGAFVAPLGLRPPSTGSPALCPRPAARARVARRALGGAAAVKSVAANPQTTLDSAQLAEWAEVTALVREKDGGLSEEAADKVVARAFGWGTQKFWRGRKKQEPPSLAGASAALAFVADKVGIDDGRLPAVLKKFPELLGMPLARMAENVAYIQRTYPSLKGDMLRNAVVDNPAVLGYDFDCEGDCKSECARCWVQF